MIKSLQITNFALIDNLQIEFNKGVNVLLGETGAGKSLIIESLNFLNGEKFKPDLIRDNTKKTIIEAIFQNISDDVKEILLENELECQQELILRREVLPSGYSRSFINDTPVSTSLLKEIFPLIIDIHSQHKNILLAKRNFLFFSLDAFASIIDRRKIYLKNYLKYKNLSEKLKTLKQQFLETKQKYDYLIFQKKELEKLNYSKQEFTNLENKLNEYENAHEIITTLSEIENILILQENSIIANIKNIQKKLNNLIKIIPISKNWSDSLENIYIQLKEICQEVSNKKKSIHISQQEYEKLRSEADYVYSLCQKYKVNDYSQLLELKKQVENDLKIIHNSDEEIKKTEEELESLYSILQSEAEFLNMQRMNHKDTFQRQVLAHLNDLNLNRSQFKIDLSTSPELNIYGINNIKFLFSANPDFPLQSIDEIASGGELSRFMLALKTTIAEKLNTSTIVFDEIDTGVSGDTAYKVGKKIKEISKNTQVIIITHTPQVASCGDVFYLVKKTTQNNQTQISVTTLDEESKIIEIARLLSSSKITETAIKHAKELLKQNM
ncbi:MAG: DNA repair protein RecN [Bacteroidales bacterium]|nr:DNA repair protein RecN [Bacteroidales bacterium]